MWAILSTASIMTAGELVMPVTATDIAGLRMAGELQPLEYDEGKTRLIQRPDQDFYTRERIPKRGQG
jgi:hypothetical protein